MENFRLKVAGTNSVPIASLKIKSISFLTKFFVASRITVTVTQ